MARSKRIQGPPPKGPGKRDQLHGGSAGGMSGALIGAGYGTRPRPARRSATPPGMAPNPGRGSKPRPVTKPYGAMAKKGPRR